MARLARLVVPGLPHHVTQRGNGRAQTFFGDADYALYRDLLAASCRAAEVAVWAWVLMPNHVHLILVPADGDGLRRALAPVHRRYAGHVHARERRTGHFWQGRFGAVAMDEAHLRAALVYVALNPVRARLAARPEDWRWSSVHAHLTGQDDGLTTTAPVVERYPDFAGLIASGPEEEAFARLRRAESIGRPLGDEGFIASLESGTGRLLKPGKRGPKGGRGGSGDDDPFRARLKTLGDLGVGVIHVWTAPVAQEVAAAFWRSGQVHSCVRPVLRGISRWS